MSVAPVWRMKKKEIVEAQKWRCDHSHTGLEHYNCWLESGQKEERIGFFDIESFGFNFKADRGIILSYCIKPYGEAEILGRTVTAEELTTDYKDKALVKEMTADILKFDRIVTYYGTGFDLPFIRTRAAIDKVKFPEYGVINHTDLYYLVRNKFQLSRNSLENACNVILGRSNKTHFNFNTWLEAVRGNPTALAEVQEHCEYDVIDLEKLWDRIIGYRKITDLSI